MHILVTGSSGMIGTALSDALALEGHSVTGLDIRTPVNGPPITFVKHDLRTPIPYGALGVDHFDLLVHLAANARVYQLVLNPDRALDNIVMTHHAIEFARKNNVPRFLFASSRETYGNGKEMPVHESSASHRNSESSYTASKISGEAYCYAYRHCYGIDTRTVRYSNVYGRYDLSDRFVPKAFLHLRQGRPFTIYGKDKTLDFTYLDDAVAGTLAIIDRWCSGGLEHHEYNIASGEQSALWEVAHILKSLLGSQSPVLAGENLTGEVMNYRADIGRIKALGWGPRVPLEDGLRRAVGYYSELHGKTSFGGDHPSA